MFPKKKQTCFNVVPCTFHCNCNC